MTQRIVVTGGAGFIGSHVVDSFKKQNAEVLVVDNFASGVPENLARDVRLYEGDIAAPATAAAIKAFKPTAVIHLAAQVDVVSSVKDPVKDAQVNVLGTLNVLNAAKEGGAKVFIAMSSGGAVYGDPPSLPASEETAPNPQSPYGASKRCADVYLDLFNRTMGIRTVSLQLANVYGPRQGKGGEAGVVPIFTKAMLNGNAPVIFGDGLQTRDFVHVFDVVAAVHGSHDTDSVSGPHIVSTNTQTTLIQLVDGLREKTGYQGPVVFKEARKGEVRKSQLSFDKSKRDFGFSPKVTLDFGLGTVVEDIRASLGSGRNAA